MHLKQKSISRKLLLMSFMVIQLCFWDCVKHQDNAPVLVLVPDKGFGAYAGEILKAEGFNEYDILSLNDRNLTGSSISQYDIVILTYGKLLAEDREMLSKYVNKGGNLIAFRPEREWSGMFGIKPADGFISEGYICVDTLSEEGRGLRAKPLQFHGQADLYFLAGGRSVAFLCKDSESVSEYPALVCNFYGRGRTYAFTYDLPKSIVFTRQGNPLSAGIEKDGITGLRAMDLFTDGWVNTSNNTLNQADLQMQLLSHCIETMSGFSRPLPRLWYFPDTLKSLVTLTNDGEYKSEEDFEIQFSDIDSSGAVMSIYIMETGNVSRNWTDKWISRRFEISGHPDDTKEAGEPKWANMDQITGFKKKEMYDLYGIEMRTIVNHWFVWCGIDSSLNQEFAAQAAIEAKHGIGLDINYAHYDNGSNQGHFLGETGTSQGNFTGSGLVMKFATSKGEILDIFQHLNNVYDQQYNENHDGAGFFNCFKGLIDRSINDEVYSFVSIKSHNDEYYFSREPLLKMLNYADSIKIPVWTAEKLLDFVKMRDEARFTDLRWSRNRLSFKLDYSDNQSIGLSVLVPSVFNDLRIESIYIDGLQNDFIIRKVKGTYYAFITLYKGGIHSISAKYY